VKIIYGDFESFYHQKTYTLRDLTPPEYICDPRFETIGLAVTYDDSDGEDWIEGPDVGKFLRSKDPKSHAFCSHNALFDACILSYRYGWVPRLSLDTLAMSRAMLFPKTGSVSLKNVALELGLGAKGDEIALASGMNLAMLKADPSFYARYVRYGKGDVRLCKLIFNALMRRGFPPSELAVIDTVQRCAFEPQFELDMPLLHEHLNDVRTDKAILLAKAMLAGADGKGDLMSNDRFAQLLEDLGVDVPTKISPVTGLRAYAFAKTDQEFIALQEHHDARVQALVAARLGHKTTLEETRTERFIKIGQVVYPEVKFNGLMPMPLRFSGAHTHRLSGDWSLNVQNLRKDGKLRKSLKAPKGKKVVAGDSSQIEARVTAWLCGCQILVDQFGRGDDVYSLFAARVFGYPVSRETPKERFLGKTSILGLGFGMGSPKFEVTVKIQSKGKIVIDRAQSDIIVNFYRRTFPEIPATWRFLDKMLFRMNDPLFEGRDWGPVRFAYRRIILPNGLTLSYEELHREENTGQWKYRYGKIWKYLFGGKLLENIVQALARIIVMDAAVRLRHTLALIDVQLALQVHDELVYVTPEDVVAVVKANLLKELRVRPTWGPDLPLDAEVGVGDTYGDAK